MRPLQLKMNLIIFSLLLGCASLGGLVTFTALDISTYNSKKTASLYENPKELNEIFLRNWDKQIKYKEQKLKIYSSVLLFVFLFGLLFLKFFMVSRVFNPMIKINSKMMDFLNGKFSYKFETPTNDEMGQFQNTFNTMAEQVLHNMQELKALDEAKSDFLNIASHELRTPMTSIKGSLGLITSGALGTLPADVMNLVKIADSESDRLIRLTNDILDMAKIEARKMPMKSSWFNVSDLINKTKESLDGFAKSAGVSILVHKVPDVFVHADQDRIQQVLTNLLSNAIKFSPKDQNIEISVNVSEGAPLTFLVKDHGRGMSPEQKSVLFQKFRQISGPDNPLVKGTGLGLAISKALIEEHQGTIGVESKPFEGSTFYFTLPNWKWNNQKEKAA